MVYHKEICPDCGRETVFDGSDDMCYCIRCGKQIKTQVQKYRVTFTTDSFGSTGGDIFYFYIDGIEALKAKKKEPAVTYLTKGIHRIDITVTSKRFGVTGTCCINVEKDGSTFKTSFNNLLPTLIPLDDFE